MKKIGFIGAGNMGGAIISGMIASGNFKKANINVCDLKIPQDILDLGINPASLDECVANSDYIVLAVKPAGLGAVLEKIKQVSSFETKTYISIAAGYKIEAIEQFLGNVAVVRVMPNLCLKAGEGMTVICANNGCSKAELDMAEKIFSSCGKTAIIKENLIDACTAINGSGPAYVFMFMEALADAAVKHGIDRETAYLLAGQTVLGSAKLMMDSQIHPAKLKDMVCSPGGTTIEAVASLEKSGLRNSVISAVDACAKKADSMSKTK